VSTGPEHGTLIFEPDGTFYYLPDPGYFGVDTFMYRASNGGRTSEPATVTLTIEPPLSTPCTVADLNADGQVTLADLGRLVESYGGSPEPFEEGDLDGDGYVGVADLPLLRNRLGQSCGQAPGAVVTGIAAGESPPVVARHVAARRVRATDRVFASPPVDRLPQATLSATRYDALAVDAAVGDLAGSSRRVRLRPAVRRTPGELWAARG
jgi:hypothetical protein